MTASHLSPGEGLWRTTTHTTPLGPIRLLASANGVAGLWFQGQRHHPVADQLARWHEDPTHPLLRETARQLDAYFRGDPARFDLPLDLGAGTAFQQMVWRALLNIPRGNTCTYRGLAEQIGRPLAVRAVGTAIGRNPLSIVVPCHRVLGSDGSLTGYAGGLDRKRALLQREAALIGDAHQWAVQTASTPAKRTT